MELVKELEPLIVQDGKLIVDSVFRFCDDIESLPAFLGLCSQKNCTVEFELEELISNPNGKLLPKDDECFSQVPDFFICSLMTYMSMYKKYFGKHSHYLMNLASQKEGWVQGQHEPILKGE